MQDEGETIMKVKSRFFKTLITGGALAVILGGLSVTKAEAAEVFKGRFDTGNLTYGIISGTNSSYAAEAVKQWNGVSSKVKIKKYNGHPAYAKLRLNLDNVKPPLPGDLGITVLCNFGKKVSTDGKWTDATCIQYKSKYLDTKNKKLKTCVHEIGHALSLAHQPKGSNSIMQQGALTRYTLYPIDKKNLIFKWGK